MVNPEDILKANILIVDDEEPNVILLERILRGAGYTLITGTSNPNKVCELYRKNHFDLILLDIQMPTMDGFQVMEALKKNGPDVDLSVLVITAQPGHKQRALQAGAKDFISKPFELVEVLTRVHNMLEVRFLHKETAEHKEDNPALSTIIERNIRNIIQLRLKASQEQSFHDRIADAITSFSGRMLFLYLHIAWFSAWILCNTGQVGIRPFDPFPYQYLTMSVALESILLSTFMLISQELLRKKVERRADLDLHMGLITEHELTRVLQMLRAIQDKMGITNDEDSNLADEDLLMETRPEDVLAEIDRLQQRASPD